jgi:hypothetical protein
LFFLFLQPHGAPLTGAKSHGESAQKTTQTGRNWDLFWFD